MNKSLPLIAGAVLVPLLAATVAAMASTGGDPDTPGATLPTAEVTVTTTATSAPEAPVGLAAIPQEQGGTQSPSPTQAPPQAADEPETPPTTTTTQQAGPTTPVAPNDWATPEPTPETQITPIAPGGPIDMAVSWDGLKCARSDAWIVDTDAGKKMMCPGSQNP